MSSCLPFGTGTERANSNCPKAVLTCFMLPNRYTADKAVLGHDITVANPGVQWPDTSLGAAYIGKALEHIIAHIATAAKVQMLQQHTASWLF